MSSTWLEQGLKLWLSETISFERDFFLPMPHSDWSGVRRVMAHYADVVGLSQHLLRMLRLPLKKGMPMGVFRSASSPGARGTDILEGAFRRNWLTTSSADEYLRTAQRVIIGFAGTAHGDYLWP